MNPAYRVVDRHNAGWLTTGKDGRYQSEQAGEGELTLDEIAEARGPWRPVVPMPEADETRLREALAAAGRKALATLAAVLHEIALNDMTAHPAERGRASILIAGRPGSWESHTVHTMAWEYGGDIAPGRIDEAAADVLRDVLGRWTSDPAGYVEVAENLASVLGAVADASRSVAGGGLAVVADQWFVRVAGAEALRNWALSRSRRHGPDTWY